MSDPTRAHPLMSREGAVALLERIANGVPDSELAPLVRGLATHDDEQALAIMRGSGNEMSVSLQLVSLLAERDLITLDEGLVATRARRQKEKVDAA
jgi:hypothetical protein